MEPLTLSLYINLQKDYFLRIPLPTHQKKMLAIKAIFVGFYKHLFKNTSKLFFFILDVFGGFQPF